jgi:hypothetical protein
VNPRTIAAEGLGEIAFFSTLFAVALSLLWDAAKLAMQLLTGAA